MPHPHPVNAARWEWLTRRELRLELIERTEVAVEESLTDEEVAELRRKQEERGEESEERGEESFADGAAKEDSP